jgi:hypothetical protein
METGGTVLSEDVQRNKEAIANLMDILDKINLDDTGTDENDIFLQKYLNELEGGGQWDIEQQDSTLGIAEISIQQPIDTTLPPELVREQQLKMQGISIPKLEVN